MILNKFRNGIKENKGFVLVYSMVAVLILAIGLAALAFLYTNGIGTLHKSDTREKAVQIAADWAEVIKTYADTNSKTLTYDDLVSYVDTTDCCLLFYILLKLICASGAQVTDHRSLTWHCVA